jgi:hypothetical protein
MKTLLTATALILFMTATASATDAGTTDKSVLASGPVLAPNASALDCFFINIGTADVVPSEQLIYESTSTTPLRATSTCPNGTSVTPNMTCIIIPAESLPSNVTLSCKFTFNSTAANLRGVIELFDANNNLLLTADMR